jgi:predicted aminopeptidase
VTRWWALVVVLGCAGCAGGPAYLVRLGWNEARILWRREPIAELLLRPETEPALKDRLGLVLRAREYGRDRLGLRVGESFSTYATVGNEAVVWVISAAYRDRLQPYTWWYPIAGQVPYRGFFARTEAESAAAALAASDLDTDVRSAVAFSTLGWFADPLLSTTAAAASVELVETVLHESFHATRYVPGASSFNESAATFVGHRGAAAFFCADPARADDCRRARQRWASLRARGRVLERLASRLRGLYEQRLPVTRRELLRARLCRAAGASLTRRGLGGIGSVVPPNNARLMSELVYVSGLDRFDRLAPTDAALPDAIQRLGAASIDPAAPLDWLPPA